MASYLVMTPPGPQENADEARFIRDGFSFAALVVPVIWMLYHRLWLAAVLLLALQVAAGAALAAIGHDFVATLVLLCLSLLIALESGEIRARHLLSKGYRIEAVVSADSLDEAEEIYYGAPDTGYSSGTVPGMSATAARPLASAMGGVSTTASSAPVLGLFDYGKGR